MAVVYMSMEVFVILVSTGIGSSDCCVWICLLTDSDVLV
jgi:hypothetical protein